LDPLLEREKNYGPSKARYDDHFAKKNCINIVRKKLIPLLGPFYVKNSNNNIMKTMHFSEREFRKELITKKDNQIKVKSQLSVYK
jgi:hypothetical protein